MDEAKTLSRTCNALKLALRRTGQILVKVLALFVILEPIWMLLPFAGFLYGSVLQIQTLNQNPRTSWLTHFVFPVLTLGWLGPILVVVGFGVFLVGAGQIYWAKIRRSGLVTRGLYRFVRHPQYVALTLFGVGLLLTWGRAIMFIAFFAMMFLYYYLAKSEERTCIRLFGQAYEEYRRRTSFILPGDKLLRPLGARLARRRVPAPVRVLASLVLTAGVCFGLMWLINAVKLAVRTVPYLAADVPLPRVEGPATLPAVKGGRVGDVPYVTDADERVVVARGPWRNAAVSGFAEEVLLRLRSSKTLEAFLSFLDEPDGDALFVWCGRYDQPAGGPGSRRPGADVGGAPGGRGPKPDPHGPKRVRLVLMRCTLSPGATVADALADKAKRKIRRGYVAQVNLGRARSEDMVEVSQIPGRGFPGEKLWAMFLDFFADHRATGRLPPTVAAVPGRHDKATLVLVQAPILRTRLDPGFAHEIRDRLVGSARFRSQLRDAGVGGEIVAVAFPRPGPNWYREHHGTPQISVFVIVARLQGGAGLDELFQTDRRELLGAFIAEMDFKFRPPADSVERINPIGLRRPLEERWRFFLSGLGGERIHAHRH